MAFFKLVVDTPSLLGLVSLLVAGWLFYRLLLSATSKLPGPWYTKLSSCGLIYHYYHGSKRMWIHSLHRQYGPVVRVGPTEVSFASAEALRSIYVSGGGFDKTELYSLFEQGGHRNLFTALEKEEKRFADRYTNTNVLQPEVVALIQERADAFVRECAKESEHGSADVYYYLHCYALDCVSAMCFAPYGTHSIEGGHDGAMVKQLSYHDSRRTLVVKHYWPQLTALYRHLTTAPLKGGSFLEDYVRDSLEQQDVIGCTLAARLQTIPDSELSEGGKMAECLDHIGAGIDTTGDTLCFLLYALSRDEDGKKVQEKLRNELCLGQEKRYLEAVVNEALRLWAPGTMPLPRYVPKGGRTLDGYYLPGSTTVSCQSYTLHRQEQTFPEAEAFRPERWLEEDDKTKKNQLMFAFGGGARLCLGKNLAMLEMRTLLSTIYSQYSTAVSGDMKESMEMADQFLTSRPRDMCCKLVFQKVD